MSRPEAKRFGYVFNVLTDDRPGIVAGVSRNVERIGGNIDACSQNVLSGYFNLVMTISLSEDREPEELGKEILAGKELENCQITVRRIDDSLPAKNEQKPDTFVITAFGSDRVGIVAAFSRYLASKQINILDLFGDKTGEGEFLLISQVEVNQNQDIQNLQLDLEAIGSDLGFTVKLQHNNIFIATNRLRLER